MEAISRLAQAVVLLSSPKAEELGGGEWKKREKPGMRFPVLSTTAASLCGITLKFCFSVLRQGRAWHTSQ